jgi:anti-anti-sigma factor
MIEAQIWKGSSFTVERVQGRSSGTVLFRLRGSFTARDMYGTVAPADLRKMFDFHSAWEEELPTLNILDLTEVPYMDSAGLGMIAAHHVRCRNRGVRMVVAGASARVLEIFKLTHLDSVIAMAAGVEEVDGPSIKPLALH